MAFVPGYKYDIFISYAHIDNDTSPGENKRWIESFYAYFKQLLDQRFGRMDTVKIWWDSKKIDGSVKFDLSIKKSIEESAVIICLNSPGYMNSPWCLKELDTFNKKAETEEPGLTVADRSRIVHVKLNNIPKEEWPPEFSGTTGFKFHDAVAEDDFGDKLKVTSDDFSVQMKSLRDAVWKLLVDFEKAKNTAAPKQQNTDDQDTDTFTIYLGEVADTLRFSRKRIVAELEKKGYRVVTGIPPPDESEAHAKATKEAIEKAQLAVHLLDEYPGREIIGAPEMWYPQKQTEISLISSTSNMIWVPNETDFSTVEEEEYKQFLRSLESGKASKKAFEFIRGSKSNIAREIIDYAEQIKTKKEQKQAEEGQLSVLLDTHYKDQLYAFELGKTLLENQIQPFINPHEGDPRKNISQLSDRISQVKKLIFLYGSVHKEWVLERISVALRLILNNNLPIEDFFVYLAPPHKKADEIAINQRFLKLNIIDSSHNPTMDQSLQQQFLYDLKRVVA